MDRVSADSSQGAAGGTALLNAALESMPYGFSIWGDDHRLVLWNTLYLDLYRLPAGRIRAGMSLRDVVELTVAAGNHPGKTADEVGATFAGWLEAQTDARIPTVHEKTLRDRVITSTYLRAPGLGWVVTHEDVTEERRALRALAEREAELARQNMRFDAAVNNMSQGLCMFDANQRLVVCNSQYASIYGLTPELTAPGTTLAEILRVRIENGIYSRSGKDAYIRRRIDLVANGADAVDVVELQDGRIIQVLHHPMADGGWVSTHQDITRQHRNEQRVEHLARHDTLTDLPNRAQFGEHMEAADARIRRGEIMALLCIDLDHFKTVNDTLGHTFGDAVLKEAGERLRVCCRESDRAARLGGDEFAVLIGPLEQELDAAVLARRIVAAMSEPFVIDGRDISIGASIGIAVSPQDGSDAETLFRNADLALYRAKGDGRSNFHFFEPAMDAALQERRRVEAGLRRALLNRELRLVFQPLLGLADNRIAGFEALLRWYDSDLGNVSPDLFIPVAEETGLIVPIGEWVLREACLTATAWPDHVRVAVNISPVQFKSRFLVERVKTALAEANLAPSRLELEVTEQLFLGSRTDDSVKTLRRLRDLGVRISMGDFGTGYSSLSHLRAFPFDKIKIDRTFVRDLAAGDNQAVVTALIGLGRSLGISTAAEGIETEAQLDLCREQGCSEAQGFLLSPPLPASAAAHLANAADTTGISPARAAS
jgi:diguanylate cyclase (GGDEF)-like protein